MNLSTCCVLCGQGHEHYWHLFYDCTYLSSCWAATNVVKPTLTTDEFPVWLLKLIDALDLDVMCSIAMILWCVWRQRNQKLWENSSLFYLMKVPHYLSKKKKKKRILLTTFDIFLASDDLASYLTFQVSTEPPKYLFPSPSRRQPEVAT